ASRRVLLKAAGAGLAGGAALWLSACGGSHRASTQTTTITSGPVHNSTDAALLNHLLDLEHLGIAAYTAGIPLLSPAGQKDGQLFLNQEISHAGELAGLVKQAGDKPHKGRETYNLGHPRTAQDVLRLLHRIERTQIDAYLDAIPKVSLGSTRAALAAMLANDAQHISVLRLSMGRRPIPTALVTGHE
ncbi:MAG TPA: ferritin-like domain-containing protein, partial [Solirubrobacteraceae bacterium]|nr:ferritin-like domain-containing protein [Solirubrobacteraceae bacterium]